MMLVPYVGELPINASTIKVVTNSEDQARVDALVVRCQEVTHVNDQLSLTAARRIGGEIKAMEAEISGAKKLAKGPFRAIENAIEERSKEISGPLLAEKVRVAGLLGAYVSRLEQAEKAERDRRQKALEVEVAEQQRRLKEADEARIKAEAEAWAAKNEAQRLVARERALTSQMVSAQAQLATEMAQEAARIGSDKPVKGKIPGGRVAYNYEYKVIDLGAALAAGFLRLFRWEIDKRSCNDEVRAQLDKDPDAEPKIPGIEITKTVNVSLRAAARIQ